MQQTPFGQSVGGSNWGQPSTPSWNNNGGSRGEEVIINSIHGKQNQLEEILGETQEDLGVDLLAGVVVVILEDPGEVVIQIMEEKRLIDKNK